MVDHLPLPGGTSTGSTRSTGGPREPFTGRRSHGQAVARDLEAIDPLEDAAEAEEDSNVLALKIKATSRISLGPLKKLHFTGLGEDEDWNYYVLSTKEARQELRNVVSEYSNLPDGNDINWEHPKSWAATLDMIDAIDVYGPDDRRGSSLDRLSFEPASIVECQLWPAETKKAAIERLATVLAALQAHESTQDGTRVLANDPRPDQLFIKAAVSSEALATLLHHGNVQTVNAPAQASVSDAAIATARMPEDVPDPGRTPIGLIDGIINVANPLLTAHVIEAQDFPTGWSYPEPDGHGTRVGGIAIWGNLEPLISNSPIGTPYPVVSARVLASDGPGSTTFAGDSAPAHETLAEAIEWLASRGVKIINMSVNYDEPANTQRNSMTYTLDQLLRQHKMVAVVSAGNLRPNQHAQHPLTDYPGYLDTPEARVASPGDSSLAVTVGSIARRDVPESNSVAAIANAAGPSHFTRTPTPRKTFTARLKPEFLHHGGNGAWNSQTNAMHINEPGTSVVVAVPGPGGAIIGSDNGTSFAAPAVAREFAILADRYPHAGPNLLRALMAISARHEKTRKTGLCTDNYAAYGIPSAERVLESSSERVIMTFEGEAQTNATTIHPLPLPPEFADGYLEQTFRVALAFDPPVRRTRREYIAGRMNVELVRGLSQAQVAETYARQPNAAEIDENPSKAKHELPALGGPMRPRLTPTYQYIQSNTLICRNFEEGDWDPDHEDYFLVVTHLTNRSTPKQREQYPSQTYALAVEVALQGRSDLDLYALVSARLRGRVRIR